MTTPNASDRERLLDEALAHYRAERWDAAAEAYARAQALAPLDAESSYRLGNAREEQGRDDEAAACFRRAVEIDPAFARAWNNLGGALQRLGRPEEAERAYREAAARDAALVEPRLNLGRLAEGRGELEAAAAHFRAALALRPGDAMLGHLVAAASGARTARAPAGYVQALFDAQAPRFDQHLVDELGYRVPEAIARMLGPLLAARPAPARVLDLGCGTGLVGAALAGAELTGVDLSARMLEVAARRGVYGRLVQGEIQQALDAAPAAHYDAVVAADVLIYIGEVRALVAGVARALAPGGAFAFSVERLETGDYRLQPSGRYAHALGYLRALADASGLQWRASAPARIRRERQGWAEGELVLLARP